MILYLNCNLRVRRRLQPVQLDVNSFLPTAERSGFAVIIVLCTNMPKKYQLSHLSNNAKTGFGKRAVKSRLPKVIENPKSLLALRGHATSAIGTALLDDLAKLKAPNCRKLQRKNEILPFDTGGEAHLENLARLNDASLFAMVNHTKKRPHNLILGRMFSSRILDMLEFSIKNYTPMAAFPSVKSSPGSSPLVLFNGDDFDATDTTKTLRSLLLDLFRGPHDITSLNLAGVDRVIVFTLKPHNEIQFRHYAVKLVKDKESTLPAVKLEDAGPRFDLQLRREHLAPEALMREAMKKPRDPRKVHKTKNVSRDDMGDKKGRIHVGKQDLSGLALARMKGLGKKRKLEMADRTEPEQQILSDINEGEDADGVQSQMLSPAKKAKLQT